MLDEVVARGWYLLLEDRELGERERFPRVGTFLASRLVVPVRPDGEPGRLDQVVSLAVVVAPLARRAVLPVQAEAFRDQLRVLRCGPVVVEPSGQVAAYGPTARARDAALQMVVRARGGPRDAGVGVDALGRPLPWLRRHLLTRGLGERLDLAARMTRCPFTSERIYTRAPEVIRPCIRGLDGSCQNCGWPVGIRDPVAGTAVRR